jgi:hypothetical protein
MTVGIKFGHYGINGGETQYTRLGWAAVVNTKSEIILEVMGSYPHGLSHRTSSTAV